MEEQVEMVGKAFVDHYYHLFDTNRTSLASLYQPSSMLTFEGQKMVGVEQITAKLNGMPFDHCKHLVSTIDSQAAPPATGGVVVFVSGSLQLFGEEHPLRFSQMFHLLPTQNGSFFVQNDIFRLNYGPLFFNFFK
ncbi:Nuclear transport factor 2B [Linum perenne]